MSIDEMVNELSLLQDRQSKAGKEVERLRDIHGLCRAQVFAAVVASTYFGKLPDEIKEMIRAAAAKSGHRRKPLKTIPVDLRDALEKEHELSVLIATKASRLVTAMSREGLSVDEIAKKTSLSRECIVASLKEFSS